MERIARFLVAHARRVLAATAVISLLAALMLFRMDFNADVTSFIVEGNERGEEFAALQQKYATEDPVNVLVSLPEGEAFTDKARLADLVALRDTLAAVDGVASVATIVPQENPLTGAPLTAESIDALPAAAISTGLLSSPVTDLLLSDDARHTLVIVAPAEDGMAVARRLGDVTGPAGLELTLSGNPVVFATVIDLLGWFLLVIPPIVILLLLAIFYANIGDRRLSVLAIVPAVLGSLWTFGLIFGLGFEVDIVTVIVPIFVIVMGSADGLHFVTHYQEAAERTDDRVERVRSTLAQVGIPMILTTISTAAGFLSLLATDVRPIRQLGVFVAVGITFAGIVSFFSLPALMSRLTVDPKHHHALLGPRLVRGLELLATRRWVAPVLGIGLVAFSAVFIPRLEVDADQLFFFKDGHEVRRAFERTEEVFGGATPLVGEFAYDPGAGEGGLDTVRSASAEMEALPGVRTVFSAADAADALPPEQAAAVLDGTLLLPLGPMVSDDGLRFVLFPGEFTSDDLRTWVDFADTADEVRTLTGMPVLWDEIARLVLRAQVGSVIAAFALVALMLLISYRRLRQTLVALVPLFLTVAALLGFIAASGIQLNLLTAVASSIVIGVGIDYSIHFVAAIDHARSEGEGFIARAIQRAGRPIVANALGIAVALTALWLSPLKIHSQVSMIMWVSMTVAALTALVMIPALLPQRLEPAVDAPSGG